MIVVYSLQTIFRETPSDPLRIGSYFWPFVARDEADAKARASEMLTDWRSPDFVKWWETGTAARILLGEHEVSWRSFDPESQHADWS